jgi:hypothetical protein
MEPYPCSKTKEKEGDQIMIKPSKVVFISDELEDNFKSLKDDDPIKKGMIRAIKDLKVRMFSLEFRYLKGLSLRIM